MSHCVKYRVIRDTREQQGWTFGPSRSCSGTDICKLDTGDYTLKNYESLFVIERKGSIEEFAQNLFQNRFWRELERLNLFQHAYLFLEFTYEDLMSYPKTTSIPKYRWKHIKVTPPLLLKRYHEMRLAHPTLRVEFVGKYGKDVASSLFKRIYEHVPTSR